MVKGAGFADAVHVGGGILAWVKQIEPDKPSYCLRDKLGKVACPQVTKLSTCR